MGAAAEGPEPAADIQRILIVEDNVLLRISTADHLRNSGYAVIEAGSVIEAAMVLSSGPPVHLVFTDVDLPGAMGGLSLVVWIHSHYPGIPVVLTSGVSAMMPSLSNQSAVPFVAKPYDLGDLTQLIAQAIANAP